MKFSKCCSYALVGFLAGCGSNAGPNAGVSSTGAIKFALPKANSQQIYARTIVDNSNNTINQTLRNTVTVVNADGSYTLSHDDPTSSSLTVNGTTYTTLPETITYNNSGQVLSFSYTPTSGPPGTCTVSPHGAGPTYPLTVGENWSQNYTISCGTATPTSYTQTGSVADVESVTVPAGTFSAVKLQSIITYTGPEGITHTDTVTTWRDVDTDIVVKTITNSQYSGAPVVNSVPVTATMALQSQS